MTQEQLLQEARKEADKVYPVIMHSDSVFESERDINEFQRHFFIQGYIQQAEKRKSEAVEFLNWIRLNAYAVNAEENKWRLYGENLALHTIEELYDLFLQQLKQE